MEHALVYEKGLITVTGVKKLDAFEEKEAKILLASGGVTIKGSGFELTEMAQTSGRVSFAGKIASVTYHGTADKSSVLKKIFQ